MQSVDGIAVSGNRRFVNLGKKSLFLLALLVLTNVFVSEGGGVNATPAIGLNLDAVSLSIGALNQTTPFVKNTHRLTISSTDTLGYTLTLSTNSTDANSNKLTNTSDNNQTINPTTGTLNSKSQLANNTWGYTLATNDNNLTQSSTEWSKVPLQNAKDTIVDKNENTSETINVTYGAYLQNAHRVKAGNYQTTVEYTATAKVPPEPEIPPENICNPTATPNAVIMPNNTIYDSTTNVRVDYDQCMIPVKYTGNITETNSGWSTANPNNTNHDWFNYNTTDKKWANALTIDKTKNWPGTNTLATDYLREKVKNNQYNIQIPNEIIKGFWVYVPRFAYEVQRPNAIDKVVQAQNFDIRFETTNDPVKTPANTCNILNPTTKQMWDNEIADNVESNILAKDYRTQCNISRLYGNATGTTWATHPAFTFGGKELNGIWVGKFEMTGKRTAPTVMPNQVANISEYIGNLYTMAKSIGVNDPVNTFGNNISGITQNSHNLAKSTSHMLKNREWGAATYLSSSMYGAGVNNVQINSAFSNNRNRDQDGQNSSSGATGCGPSTNGNTSTYTDGTKLDTITISSLTACSQNTERAYNGSLGQLASTTNNVYGIYDMSGGAYEYTMGNRSASDTTATSNSSYMTNLPSGKYIDIYSTTQDFGTKPAWSSGTNEYYYNNDVCTWLTCGGHALNETKTVQSVSSNDQSWGGDYSYFTFSSISWFIRGSGAHDGSYAGLFNTGSSGGGGNGGNGGRAVLIPEI